MKKVLDIQLLFDKAFRHFIFNPEVPYIFIVRKAAGVEDFHERLEAELKEYPFLKPSKWRKVKEGRVGVSRPIELQLTQEDFFLQKPQLKNIYQDIFKAQQNCQVFKFSEFLESYYTLCVRRSAVLADALEVFQYLVGNASELKGLLPRQIPHGVSSKLIGKEALLLAMFSFWIQQRGASWDTFFQHFELLRRAPEFRFYAPSCRWYESNLKKFHGIFFKENLSFFSFQSLERTLVIENRESLLPLVGQCEKTLLVWGEGWKCIQLAQLCEMLPKPLFYWGDLDKEGIEIADQFCTQASAKPLLMDEKTLTDHQHLIEPVGESKGRSSQIVLLADIYQTVIQKKARIEQEKMVFDWKLLDAVV